LFDVTCARRIVNVRLKSVIFASGKINRCAMPPFFCSTRSLRFAQFSGAAAAVIDVNPLFNKSLNTYVPWLKPLGTLKEHDPDAAEPEGVSEQLRPSLMI
jgi:hypothetical protein